MTVQLNLQADQILEFAFGKVSAGQEAWMFGEYFPAAAPIFADYDMVRLGGFAVLGTNFDGVTPDTGAWTGWRSANHRADLHKDTRFVPMIPQRDAAMDVFSDGHLFETMDEVITLNSDHDYAVILSAAAVEAPIFALQMVPETVSKTYLGRRLYLRPWSAADDALMQQSPDEVLVLRIRPQ